MTAPAAATPVPLWRQLQATAQVIAQVRAGGSATPALAAVEPALRGGVQALVFQVLRQLGRAEALRRHLAPRTPPPAADALLCSALALAWRAEDAPYEPFTLVDQAVEAAKRGAGTRGQTSFVNACLRRFLRERDALVAATDGEPVARWNHPRWWIERLRQDHPRQWQAILQASGSPAPMTLRVNARKSTPARMQQAWGAMNIEASPIGAQGLVLARPRPVHEIPGFAEGEVSVQDAAAQLAAPLLLHGWDDTHARPGAEPLQAPSIPGEPPRPLRILDACAAPGGKTAHLLELADAEVTALDVDAARCARIGENLQRLGLAARVLTADAAEPGAWWDGRPFDGVLLDAPCTASGIVRRHPDVPWLRREADVARLAAQQARLLAALWPLVRPGGRLVYCTCSVFRAEGEAQIRAFVTHNTDALQRPAPGHLIPQSGANADALRDNLPGDHDGFYYALLEKKQVAGGMG